MEAGAAMDDRYKTFMLRLPKHQKEEAMAFAEEEGISLNYLINIAVAEKISRMQSDEKTEEAPPASSTPPTEKKTA